MLGLSRTSLRRRPVNALSSFDYCEPRLCLTGATHPLPALVADATPSANPLANSQPAENHNSEFHLRKRDSANLTPQATFTDYNGQWFVVYFGSLDLEVYGNLDRPKVRGSAQTNSLTNPKVKGEISYGSMRLDVSGKLDMPGRGVGKYRYEMIVSLTDSNHFEGTMAFYYKNKLDGNLPAWGSRQT